MSKPSESRPAAYEPGKIGSGEAFVGLTFLAVAAALIATSFTERPSYLPKTNAIYQAARKQPQAALPDIQIGPNVSLYTSPSFNADGTPLTAVNLSPVQIKAGHRLKAAAGRIVQSSIGVSGDLWVGVQTGSDFNDVSWADATKNPMDVTSDGHPVVAEYAGQPGNGNQVDTIKLIGSHYVFTPIDGPSRTVGEAKIVSY